MPSDARGPLRLTLTNGSSGTVTFGLEPLGNFCELPPGQSVEATLTTSDPSPHLELVFEDGAMSVWEESGDGMGLDPVRDGATGDAWA